MEKSQKKKKKVKENSTDSPGFYFEDTDYEGRTVYLPLGRWENKILIVHPDLAGYENTVRQVAVDPQIVAFEDEIGDLEIHASYDVGKDIYSKKWLWLPIKYKGNVGKILSAHWVTEIKKKIIKVTWRKN